jgi:hypothetical protein
LYPLDPELLDFERLVLGDRMVRDGARRVARLRQITQLTTDFQVL